MRVISRTYFIQRESREHYELAASNSFRAGTTQSEVLG